MSKLREAPERHKEKEGDGGGGGKEKQKQTRWRVPFLAQGGRWGGVEIYGREIERMGVGGGEVLKEVRAQRRKRDRQTDRQTN